MAKVKKLVRKIIYKEGPTHMEAPVRPALSNAPDQPSYPLARPRRVPGVYSSPSHRDTRAATTVYASRERHASEMEYAPSRSKRTKRSPFDDDSGASQQFSPLRQDSHGMVNEMSKLASHRSYQTRLLPSSPKKKTPGSSHTVPVAVVYSNTNTPDSTEEASDLDRERGFGKVASPNPSLTGKAAQSRFPINPVPPEKRPQEFDKLNVGPQSEEGESGSDDVGDLDDLLDSEEEDGHDSLHDDAQSEEQEGDGAGQSPCSQVEMHEEIGEDQSPTSEAEDSLLIEPPSKTRFQATADLPQFAVQAICDLMAGPGWEDWDTRDECSSGEHIRRCDYSKTARTEIGRRTCEQLCSLLNSLDGGVESSDVEGQNRWLKAMHRSLGKALKGIDMSVKEICEHCLAPVERSEDRRNSSLRHRQDMVRDLLTVIIPMLSMVLWSGFALGGSEYDDHGVRWLVPGTFTRTTMQYLARPYGWIRRLNQAMQDELEQRPLEEKEVKAKIRTGRNQKRRKLKSYLETLGAELHEANRKFKQQDEAFVAQEKRKRQAQAMKRQRWKKQEEDRVKAKRLNEAAIASLHQLRSTRGMLSSQQRPILEPLPEISQPAAPGQQGSLYDSLWAMQVYRRARRRKPWDEEDRGWLLDELMRKDRYPFASKEDHLAMIVGTLSDRYSESEVMEEIELLKLGAWSFATENRLPVEEWVKSF